MIVSASNSQSQLDRLIRMHDDLEDQAMKERLKKALDRKCKLYENVFKTLCSKNSCRPQTLRFLINLYKKTNGSRSFDQKYFNKIMSDALRVFVKTWHTTCEHTPFYEVVGILIQNGADPFEKDRFDRDAFDNAIRSGIWTNVMALLKSSPRNKTLRRINQLIDNENSRRPQSRNQFLLGYLAGAKSTIQSQERFQTFRHKTVLAPSHQTNM